MKELKKLYKLSFNQINKDRMLTIDNLEWYTVRQQNNLLFRQIEFLTGDTDISKYFILLEVKLNRKNEEKLQLFKDILSNGFTFNDEKFVLYGKSASQAKNGVICFCRKDIADKLIPRTWLGIKLDKTNISKFEAYRNLVLSSCEFTERIPYIVIIDDYEKTIPAQRIMKMVWTEKEYVNKETSEVKTYKCPEMVESVEDIVINCFDGMGVHTPEMSVEWSANLNLIYKPVSYQVRLPYLKGLSTQMDFKSFYKKLGITEITDMWGNKHKVNDIDCIWTKSMFKGSKYFKDWNTYLSQINKYNYVLGISKYNKPTAREKKYTRFNYQYMQVLNLNREKITELSKYSTDWAEKIISGDEFYTRMFLGMLGEESEAINNYARSIQINKRMLKDPCVQEHVKRLLQKTIDEFKMGKIWIEGKYSFIVGDLIAFLQHAAGLEVKGILNAWEGYSKYYNGNYGVFRSPLIDRSEPAVLSFIQNQMLEKWCGHLDNVVMISANDILMPKLSGADLDGDIVFCTPDQRIIDAIYKDLPTVVDLNEKEECEPEGYSIENIIAYHLRTLDSRVGEISNKVAIMQNKQTTEKYQKDIALLRIINSHEIDYVKTGKRMYMPKYFHTMKELPYFLRYKYSQLKNKKTSRARSPLNELCWHVEKWERQFKYRRKDVDWNLTKMLIDEDLEIDPAKLEKIREIYQEFNKGSKQLAVQSVDWFLENETEYRKKDVMYTTVDWTSFYETFREKCKVIEPDSRKLANYCVIVSYVENPKKSLKFPWIVSADGLLENLERYRQEYDEKLFETTGPSNENNEYLGRYYQVVKNKTCHGGK